MELYPVGTRSLPGGRFSGGQHEGGFSQEVRWPQGKGRLGVATHEKGDILPLLGTSLILTSSTL